MRFTKRTILSLVILAIMTGSIGIFVLFSPSSQDIRSRAQATDLYLSMEVPPQPVTAGKQFDVNVVVSQPLAGVIQHLSAAELTITYPPDKLALNTIRVDPATFAILPATNGQNPPAPLINNQNGRATIVFGLSCKSGVCTQPKAATGFLAKLSFTPKQFTGDALIQFVEDKTKITVIELSENVVKQFLPTKPIRVQPPSNPTGVPATLPPPTTTPRPPQPTICASQRGTCQVANNTCTAFCNRISYDPGYAQNNLVLYNYCVPVFTVCPTPGSMVNNTSVLQLREFHIRAGTGSKTWNDSAHPSIALVGDTLRIINDDDAPHLLHTGQDSAPCPHQPTTVNGHLYMQKGEYYDCVLSKPYDSGVKGPLGDHVYGDQPAFWIRVNPRSVTTPTVAIASLTPTRAPSPTPTTCPLTAPTNVSITNLTSTLAKLNWTPATIQGTQQLLRVGVNQTEVNQGCPGTTTPYCAVKLGGLSPSLATHSTNSDGTVLTASTIYYYRIINYSNSSCYKEISGQFTTATLQPTVTRPPVPTVTLRPLPTLTSRPPVPTPTTAQVCSQQTVCSCPASLSGAAGAAWLCYQPAPVQAYWRGIYTFFYSMVRQPSPLEQCFSTQPVCR